MKNYIYIVSF